MGSGRAPNPPLLEALPGLGSPEPLLCNAPPPCIEARAAAACCLASAAPEGAGAADVLLGARAAAGWLRGCLGAGAGGAGASLRTGLTMSAASITPPVAGQAKRRRAGAEPMRMRQRQGCHNRMGGEQGSMQRLGVLPPPAALANSLLQAGQLTGSR